MAELFKKKQPALLKQPLNQDLNTLRRRLLILEERNNNLNRKIELLEHNFLEESKKKTNELKTTNNDLIEIKRSIDNLKNKIMLIIKELKLSAKKDELESIKKYITVWNPVQFATRKEVYKLINDKTKLKEVV